MSAFLAVFSARCRTLLQYRAAALAGVATQCYFGLIRLLVLRAFYEAAAATSASADPADAPLTLAQTASYIWLSQALFAMLPYGADGEVAAAVRSGDVAHELLRPVPLYRLWLGRALALRLAPTALRSLPLALVAWLALGLQPPVDAGAAALFALSVAAGVLVSAALTALVSASLLWTVSAQGGALLVGVAVWICSGIVVPLPLLPDAWLPWFEALPFASIVDAPIRIWVGQLDGADALRVIARQLLWAAALMLAGRALLARGLRRLVVDGG